MSNEKISALTDGTPILVTDQVPVNRAGINYRINLGSAAAHTATDFAASGANTDITSVLLNQTGLVIKGASANALTIKANETLSAPRTLNIITTNSNRNLTFTGDAILNQDVSTAGTPQFVSLKTAPVASSVATAAFGTSLTLGMPIQNTTGYNLLVNIVISVTVATGATLIMGVGSSATPTTNTAISTFSITGDFTLVAYVPNNYYLLVDKTGTLAATNSIIAMGI